MQHGVHVFTARALHWNPGEMKSRTRRTLISSLFICQSFGDNFCHNLSITVYRTVNRAWFLFFCYLCFSYSVEAYYKGHTRTIENGK